MGGANISTNQPRQLHNSNKKILCMQRTKTNFKRKYINSLGEKSNTDGPECINYFEFTNTCTN